MVSIGFEDFLKDVQSESKEHLLSTNYKRRLKAKTAGKMEEVIGHLEREDVVAAWQFIANAEQGELKQMRDLAICQKVISKEKKMESLSEWLCHLCSWQNIMRLWHCPSTISSEEAIQCSQQLERDPTEEEQKWLAVLSNPLYFGLRWLWSTNPNNSTDNTNVGSKDVIESALCDSYLLKLIGKHESHCRHSDYQTRALRLENFAAGVIEQANPKEVRVVMDNEGTGQLLHKDKNYYDVCGKYDYSASLGLLRTAAKMGRKRVSSALFTPYELLTLWPLFICL